MRASLSVLTIMAVITIASAGQDSIIAPGATLQKLAGGFAFTEGPACDQAGNVFFTDQPNDRIMKWSVEGKLSVFMQPAGRANGLCFDPEGYLWACADEKNELWRISPDGTKKVVVLRDYEGKLFNGPNDLWIMPAKQRLNSPSDERTKATSGGLFFTDPFYKRPYWNRGDREIEQAVYFLPPNGESAIRVADDLKQPNGIIGTPDGKELYIADIGAGKTYRYKVEPNGSLSNKTLFCEKGSDGLTIDSEGNIYTTSKGVFIFSAKGSQIEHVQVPEDWTANVCFGGPDRKTLFITASKSLYSLRMRVRGVNSQ